MKDATGAPELCRACQRKQKEEQVKEVKDDPMRRRREALARAERCRFFYHYTMADAEAKKSPSLVGQRTCSLTITCGCGHAEPKYNLCLDWLDGKLCNDWAEKT